MVKQLLMGNEAFAHAALEAGVRVVAGYPGTPSSELIETVAKLRADGAAHDVHVEWSTNEKSALELLAGASLCGARVLFTCKQMGLNVASDPLLCLNYIGIKGGMVLFVADDPGPISSQTEQDTRRFAMFAKVPVLDPSTPDQGFAMMKAAFALSEKYGTPVIVRPTTRICHASTFFDVKSETVAAPLPEEGFERTSRWIIFPKRAYEAHGEVNVRLQSIAHDFFAERALSIFNPTFEGGSLAAAPACGIVAGGVSASYVREALRVVEQRAAAQNLIVPAYRFLQLGTPYPFPEETVARFAQGLTKILVFEELDYVLEDQLLTFAGKNHASFDVLGKLTGNARDRGENDVDDIVERLAAFFALSFSGGSSSALLDSCKDMRVSSKLLSNMQQDVFPDEKEVVLPVRPPVLCAGCPHRGSFYAIKRALRDTPAVFCGDIGCYTLGNAKPLDAVDTCLCMGAGITMAQGFALAEPNKKCVAFVGDSTFFASGLTGLVNAVYNGHDITVVVLDNATTAMTGSQPHPGTGVTLMGNRQTPVSIEGVLRALGFECVVRANPLHLEESREAAQTALSYQGPSAILFESPCIQLMSSAAPVCVDAQTCTGCKKCITEIGCPGIGFDPDAQGEKSGTRGQAFVNTGLCNGCGLCIQVCPFGALYATTSGRSATDAVLEKTALSAMSETSCCHVDTTCSEASDDSKGGAHD